MHHAFHDWLFLPNLLFNTVLVRNEIKIIPTLYGTTEQGQF